MMGGCTRPSSLMLLFRFHSGAAFSRPGGSDDSQRTAGVRPAVFCSDQGVKHEHYSFLPFSRFPSGVG